MFLSYDNISAVNVKAHNDLLVFIRDLLDEGLFRQEWEDAENERRRLDLQLHPNQKDPPDFGEFIAPYLDWIERRQESAEAPWERRGRLVRLGRSSKAHRFLRSLLDNLDLLIEPSEEGGMKFRQAGNQLISTLLLRFGRFTVAQSSCVLSYNDVKFAWDKHPGFASWLLVFPVEEDIQEGRILSNRLTDFPDTSKYF